MNREAPLGRLAGELLRLNDQFATTPLLVLPRRLSFRPPLFEDLVEQLLVQGDCDVRIDWCIENNRFGRWWRYLSAKHQANAIHQLVAQHSQRTGHRAAVAITESLGRSFRSHSGQSAVQMIVGVCQEGFEVPSWASPIRLYH